MSEVPPSAAETRANQVPLEYSETYQRAYRRSLAAHPTELMSPARPGKRASELSALGAQRARLAAALADALANSRERILVGGAAFILLVVLAYGTGRLLA